MIKMVSVIAKNLRDRRIHKGKHTYNLGKYKCANKIICSFE